jgi:hypothetical protein
VLPDGCLDYVVKTHNSAFESLKLADEVLQITPNRLRINTLERVLVTQTPNSFGGYRGTTCPVYFVSVHQHVPAMAV